MSGVRRVFAGGVVALDGLTFEADSGSFVALLGPSGCGKSTLLRLIAGLDRPDEGAIACDAGDEPGRIAFVFQDAHLLPWRDAVGNVALPLELLGVGRDERLEAAATLLRRVGLGDALTRRPAQLSGGMRMRVSLARALVTRPRLLLLDEPFAALDEITRQQLDMDLLALWQADRPTVLFVTHSVAEAAFLAQRAVVLSARPARIVLDRRVDLPEARAFELRGSPAFARETSVLSEALRGAGVGS